MALDEYLIGKIRQNITLIYCNELELVVLYFYHRKGDNYMKIKSMFKTLMSTLLIAGMFVLPVSAAQVQNVNWGDKAYEIIVPGFIEGRDITIGDATTPAIVVEKPAQKSNGRYDFFEIVTTDKNAVMITSNVMDMDGEMLGDLMAELEDGRVVYSPTLYEDFDEISDKPLFFGFKFRDIESNTIYEFPLWIVFEDKGSSGTAETPVETPVTVKEVTAAVTSSKVIVNGKQVAFDAYNIEGSNYFKLRDLAMVLNGSEKQFEVTWDKEKNAINLISGEAYTSVGGELTAGSSKASVKGTTTKSKIYLDGEEVELEAYTINGNNYFKLRDIGKAFDFGVIWDSNLKQITIDSSVAYTEE